MWIELQFMHLMGRVKRMPIEKQYGKIYYLGVWYIVVVTKGLKNYNFIHQNIYRGVDKYQNSDPRHLTA